MFLSSSMPDFSKIIVESAEKGALSAWNIVGPYVIAAVSGTILIIIAKLFGSSIISFFGPIMGNTQRETKQLKKRFNNSINLVSEIHDLFDLTKKH